MQFANCPADGLRGQGLWSSTLAGMYVLFSGIYSCFRADQDLFPPFVFHIIYYWVYLKRLNPREDYKNNHGVSFSL